MRIPIKKGLLPVLGAALMMLSCAREARDGAVGYLAVNVGTDDPEIIVKSGEAPSADMTFSLSIVGEDGVHSYTVDDYRTLADNPLPVAAGRYTITAVSGQESTASWGSPRYSGSTSVMVKPEQVNTATITCSLTNTMVTVEFEDPIPEFFNDYRVTIDNGNGEALVFASTSSTIGNTAYFAVTGTLNYELNMVNADGVTYHNGPHAVTGVKANQHYHFKFSLTDDAPTSGGFTLTIIVDETTVYSEYKLKMDFGCDGKPITTADFPLTNELTILEGNTDSRKISFEASRGIASLVIQHASAGLTAAGLPQWTDLVTAQDLSDIQAAGVVCSKVTFGSTDVVTVDLTAFISSLPVGKYTFSTTLIDTRNAYNQVNYNLSIIPPVEARSVSAEAWAKFAILSGEWYTDGRPEGLKIQYRKASETSWTDADGLISYNDATRKITAEIHSLDASTAYVFRTVSAADLAGGKDLPEISFTTEGTPTVPNLSFDSWYQSGKAWYPNASSSEKVWDTANPGTASFSVVPTTPETSDVVSGKAARLESSYAVIKFAAGNIYLGEFVGLSGMGAALKWGYRFTGRPIALRGWYKYMPVAIDYAEAPDTSLKGQMDYCSIRVFLTDWSSQFDINTSTATFLQDDDPSIIATASLYSNVTNGNYVRFTMPIEYRDTDRNPTFIEIIGAASRYGDYFTGGKGSVLLLDEFELVYDPAELTEEERELVGYRK